jgi:hypothetical protein
MAYGRGFGRSTNGLVMYEAGHSLDSGTGAGAAQRAFMDFNLVAGFERAPQVTTTVPAKMAGGSPSSISASVTGGTFTPSSPGSFTWSASCPGTFGQASGSITAAGTVSTTFTPTGGDTANCNIKLIITDGCGRVVFDSGPTQVIVPTDV